jgi:hypothetical protein
MPEALDSTCQPDGGIALAPVLVFGAPRSGTSWLQRMLLADPRCCGGHESHFFVTFGRVLADFDRKAAMDRPHGLAAYWPRAALVEALRELWCRTVAPIVESRPGAVVLVEKTHDHAKCLDVVAALLPAARCIHLVRDSRAVSASLIHASRQPWGRGWAPSSPAAAAATWLAHVEAAEAGGAALGRDRFRRVHFEDLRRDPVATLEAVWSFIGLESAQADLPGIVASTSIDAERERGGTPIPLAGELEGGVPREPDGFFGDGSPEGWRRALGPWQRHVVWRRTAAMMRRLGYDRSGRRARGEIP